LWLVAGVVGAAILATLCAAMIARPLVKVFVQGFQRGRASASAARYSPTGGDPATTIASQPIVMLPPVTTQADVNKRRKAMRIRNYLDAYRQLGRHDKPWDADAERFLTAWLDGEFGGGDSTNTANVAAMGDALVHAGCDDPLALTAAAAKAVEWSEAGGRFERAVNAFADSKYKAYPKFFATIEMASHKTDSAAPGLYDSRALELLQTALSDGSITPQDSDDVAETLVNGWASSFFRRDASAVISAAQSAGPGYDWLAATLDGAHEINLAWQARGSGYANTVSSAGWKAFADHLAKARESLTAAWNRHPNRPLPAERMMNVCLGESKVLEERQWFDRAIAGQFDCMAAWSSLRWVLRPRWGGSVDAMRAFGIAAVNTGRFDTDVPYELVRSISDLEAELDVPVGEHIFGRADLWPHLKRMSEGYIEAALTATNQQSEIYWRGNYAELAFLAKDYEAARQELEKTDWRAPNWLSSWGVDLSLMLPETAARTGNAGLGVRDAEHDRQNGRIDSALQQYRQLISTPGIDERSLRFINARIASLEAEQKLAAGQWIDFLPSSDDDPNWVVARGAVSRLPDGALEVKSRPTGSAIYSHTRIGPEFEVTGEIEVAQSSNGEFQAGLMMGWPDPDASAWWAFRVKKNRNEGSVAAYTRGWTKTGVKRLAMVDAHRNTFTFRLQNWQATASVNGEEILRQEKNPAAIRVLDSEFALGLGAYNDKNDTVIRYRNVKVRRLGAAAAAAQ